MTSRPVSKPPGSAAAAAGTVVVYHGDVRLGELDTIPVTTSTASDQNFQFPNNEIRIHHLTSQSERCSPLSVLQTISAYSVRCKLESSSPVEQPHLINLHASCFHEFKTAVVLIGDEEIHLVAMPSKEKKFPCFWCFAVPLSLYDSCLGLLNMRCLAIVFDLDETLIVANTMKSFEDRIEALRAWIARDADPMRISGMSAELKRCMEDRLLLKQYAENDCVTDNGKVFKVQLEEVPPASDTQQERLVRPVIRLQERNIVLTRINPEIRDTSVLVRLRPAWEDLRSYLTAKGRKRFDVYVCTMAERDYALEMWRLLDPESHLISTKQLSDRLVCVKSGSRKSLLNVFHGGLCHPKMAMVIDDRAKVWEDKDQSRVHVVPPFSPYYAPQAETAHAVPVLCVARNVACNVRGYFFKEFDENFLRRIFEVSYEDEVVNLPPPPDASNYMMSEDAGFVPNGNGTAPFAEGMSSAEVERRLYHLDDKSAMDLATHSVINSPELRSEITQPTVPIIPNVGPASSATSVPSQKPSLLGAPVRRDLRTQNSGQPPILSRVPAPTSSSSSSSSIQPQGGWLVEEDICEAHPKSPPSEAGLSQNLSPSSGREFQTESGKNLLPSYMSIGVLQEIGRKCGSKVEFRPVSTRCNELEFSIEVLFTGEKIAMGMGRTRKDAQQQAADNALRNLAEKYTRHIAPQSAAVDQDFNNLSLENENGFLWETANPGVSEAVREEVLPKESTLEAAEEGARITSSSLVNNQPQKRANSPRLTQSVANKRSKEELPHGPQSLPS